MLLIDSSSEDVVVRALISFYKVVTNGSGLADVEH